MWIYEKKLQFPINIKNPDARLAKIMLEQYGGAYSNRVYDKLCRIPTYIRRPNRKKPF